MSSLLDIKGLTVAKILGRKPIDKRIKRPKITPKYILFSDGETFIELDEQDYYAYHDASSSAREIGVRKSKEEYQQLLEWDALADANTPD